MTSSEHSATPFSAQSPSLYKFATHQMDNAEARQGLRHCERMRIALGKGHHLTRASDRLVRVAADTQHLCRERPAAHARIMPSVSPSEVAMTIVVVNGHAMVGMYLASAVVPEIEVGAPQLMMRLQHVGRIAGSLQPAPSRAHGIEGLVFRRRAGRPRWCGRRFLLGRQRTVALCHQVFQRESVRSKRHAEPPGRPNLWRGSGPSP